MCLAIPGQISEIYTSASLRMGKVDFGGVVREVCLESLPEAQVGDYTIVHAGFALSILSPDEAQATLDALRQLSDINEELSASDGKPEL